MGGCCEGSGYAAAFGAGYSRHLARRYRRRGLDRTANRMVAFLEEQGIREASVLEIGGGVGAIQLELLRRGAARATNLELVDAYESDAAQLAAEAGCTGRVTRRQLDLAVTPEAVPPHDVVVLHRVVCCYPDAEQLLSVAATHATRLLVYSNPPRNLLSRLMFGAENLWRRLRRDPFRTFVHDPAVMTRAAEQGGLAVRFRHGGISWHVVGLAAPPAA